MRRTTLSVCLLALLPAWLPVQAAPARSESRDDGNGRPSAVEKARQRREADLVAEMLIQEELERRRREEARRDRVQAPRRPPGTILAGGQPVARALPPTAGEAADSGLDAVFGRGESLPPAAGTEPAVAYPTVIVPAGPAGGSLPPSDRGAASPAAGKASPASARPQTGPVRVDRPTPPAAVSDADLELFHIGYSHFSQGDYQAARRAFAGFLAGNPGHPQADSAQYWLGECAAAAGDDELALAEYRRVIDSFPFGDKVPDALLKSGDTLQRLGRAGEARAMWQEVLAEFPGSGAAVYARARLESGPAGAPVAGR